MSQIRMQTQVPGARTETKLPLDPVLMEEIQQVCVGGEPPSTLTVRRSLSSSQQERIFCIVSALFSIFIRFVIKSCIGAWEHGLCYFLVPLVNRAIPL